ncbi:MAG: hypothetical protein IIT47_06845, partial [Oscillospiraceae bacterium]|nr:hypothetical protein [Oscillospiraceae bacterium]
QDQIKQNRAYESGCHDDPPFPMGIEGVFPVFARLNRFLLPPGSGNRDEIAEQKGVYGLKPS